MSYAYDEMYVHLAQRVLGDMLDYAVNTLQYEIEEFFKMFIGCGMAAQFERGNPTYVAGMNGCEVAKDVIERSGLSRPEEEDIMYMDKSPEYWVGWSLAYYQWKTGRKFAEIDRDMSIEEMIKLYPTCHEADLSVFIEIVDRRNQESSKLKRLRSYAGLSQSGLSSASEVPLRQIQLFEQGQRDIDKTQGDTLLKLSRALNCSIEDLLMKD